ncbi:T9SS type A sorting domain-containing protein [Winogradskyella forsetii]|uniref:T9SS type A sorting domain-containing protein n=1 Tax=Winogradskyella forsetii TaxID=2686077 RepID=UPI0015BAF9B9|nr:T9SS type A sorting domain-containing protein [Winogradskyella forsetii]
MKKITLLMAILFTSLSFSQVSIGTGNDGGNAESPPINAYYGYSYAQSIYLASEINATGDITSIDLQLLAGADFSSADEMMDVWIGHTTKTGFDSTTDWVDVSTLTQVLTSGTVTVASDILTITFSSPFTYNGTDNLIIAVDANEADFGGTGDRVSVTDGPTTNLTLRYLTDSVVNNPDPLAPPSGTRFQSRGNITFNGITATCVSAEATASIVEDCGNSEFSILVDVTDLGSSVNLEITNDAGVASTTVTATGEVTVGPFPIGTPVVLTLENESSDICDVTLDSILDLCPTAATTLDYYNLQFPATLTFPENEMADQIVYAQAYEAGLTDTTTGGPAAGIEAWIGYSDADTDPSGSGWTWEVASFNVEAGNNDEYLLDMQDLSLGEGTYYYASRFRLNAGPFMYGGILADGSNGGAWDGTTNISGVLTVEAPVIPPGEGCDLPFVAIVEADCSTATPITIDFATAPNIGGTGTCDASGDNRGFWYEFTAPASGTVNISNSGSNNEFVILDACGGTEILCGAMDASNEISGLTPAAVYKMAIWKDSFQTLSTDDFCIQEVNCSAPSALMASDVTTTSAELSWTAGGSEILWDIELVDITAGDTVTGTATATGVSNPYTQMGLAANNEYEYYVLADCGGSTSVWAGPFSFTTPCNSFVPDYLESFDTGVAPSCWIEAGSGDPTTGPSDLGGGLWNHDEFANIGSTNNSAQINLYTTNREDWLISPSFDLSGGSYELVYTVALTDFANSNPPELNGMGSDDEVQVLITTDGGASWINLATYNQSSYPSETGDVETFDLSAYTGTVQFAIWATDGTVDDDEDYDFFIDEFIVRTPLACVSAVVDSSDIFDDCDNSQFYVDIDITTVGDATQINDGTTTYAITGTGVLQVGPYTDGSTVTLTVEHSDVACNFSLGDFIYTCPPSNDLFADAIVIACGDVVSGTTLGATQDEADAPDDTTVETNTAADNDSPWVWYSLTGTGASEIVTLSTCGTANTNFDTEIFVYTGTSGSLTLIDDGYDECGGASENYAAETSFTSDGTTTYYVAIGGYQVDDVGNFQLTVSCETVCTADAGTLTADATPVSLVGGTATISATPNGDIVVPTDYDVTYVLTSGANLVIEQAGATPSFDVTTTGDYTIHTLVAETTDNTDPNYLDLSVIDFGMTTGGDVLTLVGDNDLCASLDVTGAPITVDDNLSIDDVNEASFTYHPNPVKNALTLNAQNTIEQVAVYNMLGQEVLTAMPNSVDSDLDMSNLQTGTYFVKVTIANITKTIRVIKQ